MACRELNLAEAAAVLAAGGVLILPTDTLPGLHARADHPAAVSRIRRLKGRPESKPMLVLAGSVDQALSLLQPLRSDQEQACRTCWPGPFTLILPGAGLTDASVAAEDGRLAVRVPDHDRLRKLVMLAQGPLVSTSVNRSGQVPVRCLDAAVELLGDGVDGFWRPASRVSDAAALASCLVDLTGAVPKVLRAGPLPFPPPATGVP